MPPNSTLSQPVPAVKITATISKCFRINPLASLRVFMPSRGYEKHKLVWTFR